MKTLKFLYRFLLPGLITILPLTVPCTPVHATPAPVSGMNISGVADWDTGIMFADAMKTARFWSTSTTSPWLNPTSKTPVPYATLDPNGWPMSDCGICVISQVGDSYGSNISNDISGVYTLSFTGTATVSMPVARVGVTLSTTYNPITHITTGTISIPYISSGGGLMLAFSNSRRAPGDPYSTTGITNIKLMRPISPGATVSYPSTTTFTTQGKALCSTFSTLRFMKSLRVEGSGLLAEQLHGNGKPWITTVGTGSTSQTVWPWPSSPWDATHPPVMNWEDRTLPGDSPVGESGAGWSYEHVIQLCNETGCDGWINIPIDATDDYLKKLAYLCKYGSDVNGNVYTSTQANPAHAPLNSNLHLYIEYGNELWNWGYWYDMMENDTLATNQVNAGNSPLNYDNSNNHWTWMYRRVLQRITEVSTIFRSVFGDAAMITQIRPVYEFQMTSPGNAAVELEWFNNYYNNGDGVQHVTSPHPVSYYLYGTGGAAYWWGNDSSVDNFFSNPGKGQHEPAVSGAAGDVLLQTYVARNWGIKSVCYEGGLNGPDMIAEYKNPSLYGTYSYSYTDANGVLQTATKTGVLTAGYQFIYNVATDPRIAVTEQNVYNACVANGLDLVCNFCADGVQSGWGLFYDIANLNTPKMQGYKMINAETSPSVTGGDTVPGVVPSSHFQNWSKASYALVNAQPAGTYTLTVSSYLSGGAETSGGILGISVNGGQEQFVNFPAYPNAWKTPANLPPAAINLNAGQNGIRLRYLTGTGSMSINSLSIYQNPGVTMIPVPNGSFEDAIGPAGTTSSWWGERNGATSWSPAPVYTGDAGGGCNPCVVTGASNSLTGYNGNNCFMLFTYGPGTQGAPYNGTGAQGSSSLGKYKANTTYTLTVSVASDLTKSRNAVIALATDATTLSSVVASQTVAASSLSKTFQDVTVTFTTGASGGVIGKDIVVFLEAQSTGGISYARNVYFDNVRLQSSP